MFCLPYLGAGASVFSKWQDLLLPDIQICPIQLPGREERRDEPPIKDARDLLGQIALSMEPLLDRPFAIYGHSFGGNLAMSLASYLQDTMDKVPMHLFIGAAVSPGTANPLEVEFQITDRQSAENMTEESMIQLLMRLGAPDALLENQNTLRAMMPALRADLAITRQRMFPVDHVVHCPITAFSGDLDHIYDSTMMEGWKQHTRSFSQIPINGGHLFLHEDSARKAVTEYIKNVLSEKTKPTP